MDFLNAADAIRKEASKYEKFVFVAEALSKIGSIEQATKDAESRKAAAYEATQKAEADLLSAKANVAAVEDRSRHMIASAGDEANRIRQQAADDARTIAAGAERDAQAVLASARNDAANVADMARANAAALAREAQEARTQMTSALAARDAAKAELAKLNAQIDEARATIKKMMGA